MGIRTLIAAGKNVTSSCCCDCVVEVPADQQTI